jgi:ribose transport system substrate-binding protein
VLYIEGPSVRDVTQVANRRHDVDHTAARGREHSQGRLPQQSGHRAIKSWMALSTSRDLHVGMIACQNDDMAMGARRAFEELGDMKARDSWLSLPITGCDGVPKSGQSWVRESRLAATVISPPLVGDAMHLVANALTTGTQPAERTLMSPISFPALKDLAKAKGQAQGSS